MKHNKFIKICIFLVILAVLIFISTNIFKNQNKKLLENDDLKNKLISQIKTQDIIQIKNVTTFTWDKMYILTPYNDIKELSNKYRIKGADKIVSHVEVTEGINLLIFTHNNEVISYVNFPTKYGDFEKEKISISPKKVEYNPSEANFIKIIKDEQIYLIDK